MSGSWLAESYHEGRLDTNGGTGLVTAAAQQDCAQAPMYGVRPHGSGGVRNRLAFKGIYSRRMAT